MVATLFRVTWESTIAARLVTAAAAKKAPNKSSGYLLAVGWMQTLFAPWNFPGWLLAAAVLLVALARELALTKKGVEEAWSLSFER